MRKEEIDFLFKQGRYGLQPILESPYMHKIHRFKCQVLIHLVLSMYDDCDVEWNEEDQYYSIELTDGTVVIIYNDSEDYEDEKTL